MTACVLLDGELTPAQYTPERIVADDVQTLMGKIQIEEHKPFSDAFPDHMPIELTVTMQDGTVFTAAPHSYEGFHDNPLSWEGARKKFDSLVTPFADEALRDDINDIVKDLENRSTKELVDALARVSTTRS